MDKNDDSQASVKILILGESAVGKTSILHLIKKKY